MPPIARAVSLGLVAVLAACAATTLENSWKDPKYSGGPATRVLVIGIAKDSSVRRTFEDTFAQALTQAGAQAVASHTLLPQDGQIAEDDLQKAVEQAGVNGVLITRMVGRHKDDYVASATVPPPMYGTRRYYNGYYSSAWSGSYEPAEVQQFNYDYVVTETILFRSDAPEPVWSGTARTPDPRYVREAAQDFSKAVISALKEEGLI
jgi:hypothetical protein